MTNRMFIAGVFVASLPMANAVAEPSTSANGVKIPDAAVAAVYEVW